MFSVMYFNVAFEKREGSRTGKKKTESLVGGWVVRRASASAVRERGRLSAYEKSHSEVFPPFEGGKLFFVFVYFFQLDALAREENCLAREKSDFWCVGVVVKSLVKVPRVFIDGRGGKCTERAGKSFPWK